MQRVLVIVLIILILAAAVAAILILQPKTATDRTNRQPTALPAETNVAANVNAIGSPEQQSELDARAAASLIAERFGSYSSETLSDLPAVLGGWLTASGQADAANFVRQESAKYAGSATTVGISSRSLTVNVKQFQPNRSATVEVTLNRAEAAVGQPSSTRQQTLQVELIREADRWLGSHLTWLE